MATSSRRDVKLVVETETLGEEGLRRLANEVRALAKAGGDMAPEFAAAAAQLDRLAGQDAAISSLKALNAAVTELAGRQEAAATAAVDLSQDLSLQRESVDNLRAAQVAAVAAVRGQVEVLAQQRRALSDLKANLDGVDKSTESYAAQLRGARAAVADAATQLRAKRTVLADLSGALNQAVSAERDLASAHRQAASQAEAGTQALRAQRNALADAEASAKALGVEITDLVAAEQALRTAQEATVASVRQAAAAQAEAQRSAAAGALALAEANERARIAAQSELAALRDSEQFVRQYEAAIEQAAAAVRQYADTLDGQNAEAMQRLIALNSRAAETYYADAQAAREAARAAREKAAADEQAANAAQALAAVEAELANIEQQNASVKQELAARNKAAAEAYEREMAQLTAEIKQQAVATEAAVAEGIRLVEALDAEAVAAEKASRRMAELNAVAEKTARDAQYVREVAAAFDAVERQAREAAAEVQRVQGFFANLKAEAEGVNQAFGQTGVRSFDAIRREMFGVNQAVATLRAEFAAGSISAADLGRAVSSAQVRLATLKREMETIPALPGTFERLSSAIGGLINRFGALGAAVATVGVAVKPVLDATIALDQMRRVLTQVTGSATEAARQIEFVRDTAQRAGQSVTDVGQAYSKFAASALQAGLSQRQVAEAFAAVSLAAGNLGLSTEQSKRALEALSQMASKGVIGMEELRQQLGDALPGVLPLLARELGLTTQQLNKVVETGGLLASEGIPAISRALKALGPVSGEVDGLVAGFNRLKNGVMEAATVFTDGPFGFAIGATLKALAAALSVLVLGVATLSEAFRVAGAGIYEVIDALANRRLPQLGKALREATDESVDRLTALSDRMFGMSDAAARAAPAIAAVATAAKDAAAAHGSASDAADRQAASVTAGAQAATSAAAAQGALAGATGKATEAAAAQATATAGSARSFAQLSLSLTEQIKAAELAARNTEKHTQAVKDGAAALVKVAELTGSDVRAKQAQAQASEEVARAARSQAQADEAVVATLKRAKVEQVEYATAHKFSAEQIKAVVKELDEKISKASADAEKSQQAARLAAEEAASRKVLSETYKDNSKNLEAFRGVVASTAEEVARVSARYAEGRASLDQLQAATRSAAAAQALFRDALADTERVARARIETLETDTRVLRAKISSEIAYQQAAKVTAEAIGDTNDALQRSVNIKELERKATLDSVEAKRKEAEIDREMAQLARDEAIRAGEFVGEKKLEIESRLRNAEAKLAEANAGKEAVRVIDAEIDALRRRQAQQGAAAGDLSPSTTAKNKKTKDEKAKTPDAMGGTYLPPPDNSGQWTWVPALNQGFEYGGYWEKAGAAGGPGQLSSGATRYTGMETGVASGASATPPYLKPAPTPSTTAAPSGASTNHFVTINLGGRVTTVNMASESDASNLAGLLQQLETAAGRGG